MAVQAHAASFRDPNGFIFSENGRILRRINSSYSTTYQKLMDSGLYGDLVQRQWLVEHEEVGGVGEGFRTIAPQRVPFISYPYEWCFSALKQAALLTLDIQQRALEFGMSLKDASAYNIQFFGVKPRLIDTLSFEVYREGQPWVAYRQFCQHFLAPLALMSKVHIGLGKLLQTHLDGIPLELASKLMPISSWLKFGLLFHLHLHAQSQRAYGGKGEKIKTINPNVSKNSLCGIVDGLRSCVQGLAWKASGTEWADYYDDTNYSDAGMQHKHVLVEEYLKICQPATVWDLGANTGEFSQIARKLGAYTLSFDIDAAAVERNFRKCMQSKETNLMPLVLDLTNPSPSIGWAHQERDSLAGRGPTDVVMALALIHHLAISNNTPLEKVAQYLSLLGKNLIIEFVPKEDSQVQRLLSSREDIFSNYDLRGFEQAFSKYFSVARKSDVNDTKRTLFLMQRR